MPTAAKATEKTPDNSASSDYRFPASRKVYSPGQIHPSTLR